MNECMVQSAPLRDRGPARASHRMWYPLTAETCSMRTSRSNVAGPVVAPPEAPGLSTRKCEWRSTSVRVPFMAANTSVCSKVIKLGKSCHHTSEQRWQHPYRTLTVGSQRRTSTEYPEFNDLFSCILIHLQIIATWRILLKGSQFCRIWIIRTVWEAKLKLKCLNICLNTDEN